jgi:ubiquinone/menaquinone biosynthesis C-methylase UbiE
MRDGRSFGFKNGYEMLVCSGCGTIYTSSLPSEGLATAYDDYYTEANLTVPDFIHTRANEIIAQFAKYRLKGRMLDIGSGSGVILDAAKAQGWEPLGLEVSAPAVEHTRKKGLEVFHGTLEEATYPGEHFDLVTASEILEHVPDPQETLNEIARILRPGGMFWGTTPSATGTSFRLLGIDWSMIAPPEHAQLFSAKAVTQMCRRGGFTDVTIRTHGVAPGEIMHHYKNRKRGPAEGVTTHDRLEGAYQLNENLTRTPLRRFVKSTLNATLNAFRLGDSLKIFARK